MLLINWVSPTIKVSPWWQIPATVLIGQDMVQTQLSCMVVALELIRLQGPKWTSITLLEGGGASEMLLNIISTMSWESVVNTYYRVTLQH